MRRRRRVSPEKARTAIAAGLGWYKRIAPARDAHPTPSEKKNARPEARREAMGGDATAGRVTGGTRGLRGLECH